jgi:hypothetical protein
VSPKWVRKGHASLSEGDLGSKAAATAKELELELPDPLVAVYAFLPEFVEALAQLVEKLDDRVAVVAEEGTGEVLGLELRRELGYPRLCIPIRGRSLCSVGARVVVSLGAWFQCTGCSGEAVQGLHTMQARAVLRPSGAQVRAPPRAR